MTPTRITTFRLDDELLDGLRAIKDRDGIPVSEQVRRALQAWIAERGMAPKTARKRATPRKRA